MESLDLGPPCLSEIVPPQFCACRDDVAPPLPPLPHSCVSLLYSSAWLTGYEHPVIETINQRIEDLTGLEVDTAEELQVNANPREHQQGFSLSPAALI